MSTTVSSHAEKNNLVGVECLLELPKTLSKSNKKWQVAFIKIYCSRTLLNCAKHAIGKPGLFPRSLSYTAIDLDRHQDHHKDFKIDQETLNDLVKNKNQEKLESLGGPKGLVSALKTNTRLGINEEADEIQRRRSTFGSNTYTRPPSKSLIHFVIEAFKDLTILILLGCATLSLGFGIKEHGLKEGWYDGGSIFVAVFLVVAVSAVSNFRQNRQFDKLSKVSSNIKIDVVRNGRRQEISIFDIVVGDIICLNIGDQVPADGVFVEGHSLHVDESSMTGESDHVEVNLNGNRFLFSGTKVADGFGKMVVTSVGMNTAWGQMMSHISRDTNEQTPLQTRLDKLTSSIGKVGLLVAFLVLLVLLIRYFTGSTKDESGKREYNGKNTKSDEIVNAVVEMVAAAVTIIVVAIPEGLPLAVTLTLAYSMKRMMKDQAMVRKLSACETMGSATTICTDKTATEKPTNDLMKNKPVGRTAPLITNVMWRNLLAQAFYQISVLLVLQFRGRSIFGVTERVKNTLIFNTFVLCQVFNEFNARSLEKKNVFRGLHKNRLFVGIIVVTVVLQVVMVEFLKRFADTERLNWGQWGVCLAIAAASWPIGWLVKSVPVPEKHFFSYLKWTKRS
ncbi:hypothetical protein BRARA_A02693 [Brassica rapa]|uniref:Cation-transporting P-type ATPase N-terminal domain-containing protein n=1 Tax=Brassica campestris TaxID=3711 RepID=A0A398ASS2_BRACM|nr:hypothetical protein BRARA_A02693 [Brassica rapa]